MYFIGHTAPSCLSSEISYEIDMPYALKIMMNLRKGVGFKLERMVTYLLGLLLIKSHDSLIPWSCEIT